MIGEDGAPRWDSTDSNSDLGPPEVPGIQIHYKQVGRHTRAGAWFDGPSYDFFDSASALANLAHNVQNNSKAPSQESNGSGVADATVAAPEIKPPRQSPLNDRTRVVEHLAAAEVNPTVQMRSETSAAVTKPTMTNQKFKKFVTSSLGVWLAFEGTIWAANIASQYAFDSDATGGIFIDVFDRPFIHPIEGAEKMKHYTEWTASAIGNVKDIL